MFLDNILNIGDIDLIFRLFELYLLVKGMGIKSVKKIINFIGRYKKFGKFDIFRNLFLFLYLSREIDIFIWSLSYIMK